MIKKVNKGSCIVVRDRNDYLLEAERRVSDSKVYIDVSNTENILSHKKQVIKYLLVLKGEVL